MVWMVIDILFCFFFLFLAGLCFYHYMWAFSSFSKWELSTWTGWTLGSAGFSRCSTWAQGYAGLSISSSRALEHRLSSGGLYAYLSCSMWDIPKPRIKLMSSSLAGGFPTDRTNREVWYSSVSIVYFDIIKLSFCTTLVNKYSQCLV